jgi:hypothetical protein
MMSPYLQELNDRLAEGLARLPETLRQRNTQFLLSKQNADGGFMGRDGESDLYYTGFALRGLAALDALTPEICERSAGYLRSCLARQTSVVDFFSFLYACVLVQASSGVDVLAGSASDWPDRVAAMLATFRTPDHGYNKSPGSASGSTYHTFLVALCFELLGRPMPDPDRVLTFVASRRREDGGYVEVAAMRRSGANPTAAAIGLLQLLRGRDLPGDGLSRQSITSRRCRRWRGGCAPMTGSPSPICYRPLRVAGRSIGSGRSIESTQSRRCNMCSRWSCLTEASSAAPGTKWLTSSIRSMDSAALPC